MNEGIKNLTEVYFREIPFSDKTIKARNDIEAALDKEYESIKAVSGEKTAIDELVMRYPRLIDMARLAGYTAKDCEIWRQNGHAKNVQALKKELRSQRRKVYFSAFAIAFSTLEIMWFIYNISVGAIASAVMLIAFIVLPLLFSYFMLNAFTRNEKAAAKSLYDAVSFNYLCLLYDKYIKRRQNGIALFCMAAAVFALTGINLYGISKPGEVFENMLLNSIIIEIPLFLCIKNHFCFKMIYGRIRKPVKKTAKMHFAVIALFSFVYWCITILTTVIFKKSNPLFKEANFLLISGVIFITLISVYNLSFRKQITFNNITVNKKRISVVMTAVVLVSGYQLLNRDTWYTQPYINSIPVVRHETPKISYDDLTGVYTITSPEDDFRILHLTDIHLGGSLFSYSKDLKALNAVYTEIEYAKPDFVIVTGDLCFPLGIMSLSLNNHAPINQFAAFMRNINIPWAFTYGNHDTESIATTSKKDLNETFKGLSFKTSANLLYPYTQPPITGRSNQLIKLLNTDGSFNTALFLIDSNAYTGNGINDYDYIHDDQVDWYADELKKLCEEEGSTVPSMVFFHIPLQQYRTAYELYTSGSNEVKYFFGENNEKMLDKVCCSDYPSKLFDTMVELGSTKAVFCGHDHYNNMSLEYKGIRLTYGMSIDYLAMPDIENDVLQRGAELITIHNDGSFDIVQIPLVSIQ